MLNRFRNAMRGVVAWVVGILIILAMAVVGVPALDNFGGSSAIKVGSTEISARDLELELRNQIQTIQLENPNVSRDQILGAGVAQQTINQMITRALVENEARRLGLVAPDSVIQAYVQDIEGFADPETGEFDQQRLGFFLQQRGLSLTGFRELIAGDLLRSQIVDALGAGETAPEELTRLLLLREFEERSISVADLPITEESLRPSEEEAEAFYQENIERFQSPEYRTLTVVTITEDTVADQIDITEGELRQLYEARAGRAAAAETRSILQLRVDPEDEEKAAALMAGGADIETIADELGGAVTALRGQTRGDFIDEAFAEAVFSGEEGEVVGPVSTAFGTVFAEVTAVDAADGPSFDEQREQLEADLRAEIAQDRIAELVEEIELARDEGAGLREAASSVGLTPRTTAPVDSEFFTRTGSIANVPGTLGQEGFRLEEGQESRAILLDDGYGFVAVEDIEAPRPEPLEEVRPQVEAALRAERRQNVAEEFEARFRALLDEGMDFAEAARELGGSALDAVVTPRGENAEVPQEVARTAFDIGARNIEAVAASGEPSVYVVRVDDVAYAEARTAAATAPAVAPQFGSQIENELAEAYTQALRRSTDVRLNEKQIARAIGRDQE